MRKNEVVFRGWVDIAKEELRKAVRPHGEPVRINFDTRGIWVDTKHRSPDGLYRVVTNVLTGQAEFVPKDLEFNTRPEVLVCALLSRRINYKINTGEGLQNVTFEEVQGDTLLLIREAYSRWS